MNLKDKLQHILARVKQSQPIDISTVTVLYTLTQKTLPGGILFILLIAIFLYSELSYTIVIWAGLVIAFIVVRLYHLYLFKTNFQLYTVEAWYKKFLLFSFSTAIIISSLSFIFLPYLDGYDELFVVISLVIMSAGGTTALGSDFRIAIAYVCIIMLPLIGTLLIIHTTDDFIIAILIIVFFILQVNTIYNNFMAQQQVNNLKKRRTLLDSVFSESPLPMFSFDTNLNILYTNKHVHTIFGKHKIIKGRNINSLNNAKIINVFDLALTKNHQSYRGPYITPNGTFFWLRITAFSFKDSDNTVLGGVAIIEDHTQKYRDTIELEVLHEELQKQIEDNQLLLDEKKQFIADMVHQIKTPLSVIMTNTSLIEMKGDENISSYATQINSAINMLSNSYEDLSYIISNDTIAYMPVEIDMSRFLHERVNFFGVIANANSKTIYADITNNIKTTINDTELERLIDNNLSNALKHSYENSEVEIILKKTDLGIIFKCISKGPNIRNISKIFDKDYTESYGAKRSLGLGLNMVKTICEKNDIQYSVHSKDNMNTFTYIFKGVSS